MTAMWIGLIVVGVGCFFLGHAIGVRGTNSGWLLRMACRSAHCCRGKFYYIVPESRYVEMGNAKQAWDSSKEKCEHVENGRGLTSELKLWE